MQYRIQVIGLDRGALLGEDRNRGSNGPVVLGMGFGVTERALPGDVRRLGFLRQRRQESTKAVVVHDEWRRKVMPMRTAQARRAIQQLQEQQGSHDVVGAELQGQTLVLSLRLERPANPDDVAAKALDAAWPEWRECVG